MAKDSTLSVRRAVLTLLKQNATVTAIVAAASIHPPGTPDWPFIRYGSPSGIPLRAACVDGNDIAVALHGFAKPRTNASGQVVETAEDHCARMGAAIAAALDGQKVTVDGRVIKIRWAGSQLLQDGAEADAYHTIQNFRVRVLS